jgi:hypothetical protein
MKKFNIEVQEFLTKVIEIEAETSLDAIKMAKNQYKACEIVLNSNDCAAVDFIDIDDISPSDELKNVSC